MRGCTRPRARSRRSRRDGRRLTLSTRSARARRRRCGRRPQARPRRRCARDRVLARVAMNRPAVWRVTATLDGGGAERRSRAMTTLRRERLERDVDRLLERVDEVGARLPFGTVNSIEGGAGGAEVTWHAAACAVRHHHREPRSTTPQRLAAAHTAAAGAMGRLRGCCRACCGRWFGSGTGRSRRRDVGATASLTQKRGCPVRVCRSITVSNRPLGVVFIWRGSSTIGFPEPTLDLHRRT